MPKKSLQDALRLTVDLLWDHSKDGEKSHRRGEECVSILGRSKRLPLARADIQALKSELLSRGLKSSTVNRYLSSLSSILKCAEDSEWGEAPKIRWMKEPEPRERILTDEEQKRLFEHLPPGYRDLALFLVETGLRVGEAIGLRYAEVREGAVSVRRTKGNRARRVPLSRKASQALEGREHSLGPWSDVSQSAFNKAFQKARSNAGLDLEVTPHCLRHTLASRLLAEGVALATIQAWLGHADIRTTMRYAHLERGKIDEAGALLDGRG